MVCHPLVAVQSSDYLTTKCLLSFVFTIFGETASGLSKYGRLYYDSLILITVFANTQ